MGVSKTKKGAKASKVNLISISIAVILGAVLLGLILLLVKKEDSNIALKVGEYTVTEDELRDLREQKATVSKDSEFDVKRAVIEYYKAKTVAKELSLEPTEVDLAKADHDVVSDKDPDENKEGEDSLRHMVNYINGANARLRYAANGGVMATVYKFPYMSYPVTPLAGQENAKKTAALVHEKVKKGEDIAELVTQASPHNGISYSTVFIDANGATLIGPDGGSYTQANVIPSNVSKYLDENEGTGVKSITDLGGNYVFMNIHYRQAKIDKSKAQIDKMRNNIVEVDYENN